jgi:predicted TIM-barrel fold metal-dependent hydrolase
MYTAQGYRPWDMRLPVLRDFYARCVTQRIPIMNHCTPDGAPAFDREAYLDFEHPRDNAEDEKSKYGKELTTPAMRDSFGTATGRAGSGSFKKAPVKKTAKQFFIDEFVSPGAWKKVLQEYPTLRLCLAHFGGAEDMKDHHTTLEQTWCGQIVEMIKSGNYPYLYADLSSSFANATFRRYFQDKVYPDPDFQMKIRKRILFGSDWYLTILDGKEYREYCETAKNFLDDMDTSLWVRFTQVNPYYFYRLDEQIQRIAGNIIDRRQKDKDIIKFFGNEIIKQKEIDDIYKEAAYIKIANKFFVNYEES